MTSGGGVTIIHLVYIFYTTLNSQSESSQRGHAHQEVEGSRAPSNMERHTHTPPPRCFQVRGRLPELVGVACNGGGGGEHCVDERPHVGGGFLTRRG